MLTHRAVPYLLVWAMFGLLFSCTAHAQTPVVGTERLQFDQAAPDLATAQAYVYRLVIDGVRQAVPVTVTCAGSVSPFACTTPFPALTPGDHTIALTAAVVVNGVEAESLPSVALPVRLVVAPNPPQNLRIVR